MHGACTSFHFKTRLLYCRYLNALKKIILLPPQGNFQYVIWVRFITLLHDYIFRSLIKINGAIWLGCFIYKVSQATAYRPSYLIIFLHYKRVRAGVTIYIAYVFYYTILIFKNCFFFTKLLFFLVIRVA